MNQFALQKEKWGVGTEMQESVTPEVIGPCIASNRNTSLCLRGGDSRITTIIFGYGSEEVSAAHPAAKEIGFSVRRHCAKNIGCAQRPGI